MVFRAKASKIYSLWTSKVGHVWCLGYWICYVPGGVDMEHSGTFRNIPEHPGTWNNSHNYEKICKKLNFQQLNETKLNCNHLGKLKGEKKQIKTNSNWRRKRKMKCVHWVEARNLNWTSPFLSLRFAINLIAWLSLIPKTTWWLFGYFFNQTMVSFSIQFITSVQRYLTIRPVALSGYGSIAHEAKPNGLLTRGPWGRRV